VASFPPPPQRLVEVPISSPPAFRPISAAGDGRERGLEALPSGAGAAVGAAPGRDVLHGTERTPIEGPSPVRRALAETEEPGFRTALGDAASGEPVQGRLPMSGRAT
jgi:hypothetical protein